MPAYLGLFGGQSLTRPAVGGNFLATAARGGIVCNRAQPRESGRGRAASSRPRPVRRHRLPLWSGELTAPLSTPGHRALPRHPALRIGRGAPWRSGHSEDGRLVPLVTIMQPHAPRAAEIAKRSRHERTENTPHGPRPSRSKTEPKPTANRPVPRPQAGTTPRVAVLRYGTDQH
ncbi:hypothetical protein GCM10022402_46370 [Salinactinospora qingdaonensis]|uniref:Uncharacterized protein n=1 Tax=Salinactinospora qingdaonensis TaxID=702744 RepID=A0ABP7GL03_9ACTN